MKVKKSWLNHRVVLLTGASSGIGKELAKVLIQHYNCHIIGVARRESLLEALKVELGNSFNYYPMDVTKKEDWQTLHQYLANQNISIDILINNAGIIHPFTKFSKIDDSTIQNVYQTNFFSTITSLQLFYQDLVRQKGGIVNICSAAAFVGIPGMSIYSSSKAALSHFIDSIRYEVPSSLYVGSVYPGFVKTNLFQDKNDGKSYFQQEDEKLIRHFGMTSAKNAHKIAAGLHRRKKKIIVGCDARLLHFLGRYFPSLFAKTFHWITQIKKMKSFDDIFE